MKSVSKFGFCKNNKTEGLFQNQKGKSKK